MYILKGRNNTPINANIIPTTTPTEIADQRTWTAGPIKRVRNNLGPRNPEPTIILGKPTRGPPETRYIETEGIPTNEKEDALPSCNQAYTDKLQTGARAQKRKSKGVAEEKGGPGRQAPAATTTQHNGTYNSQSRTHMHHPHASPLPHPYNIPKTPDNKKQFTPQIKAAPNPY
jgi:hypothetical protein